MLVITILSAAGTLVWSVIDRQTRNYNKLFYWLTAIVRYYVALTMVSYGMAKVIKLQFPAPSLGRLMEPFGNASPMGLAWTYMGYSTGFNYFTGFAELLCGLLLFFRKTTTLGAIIGLVVAGNIMAINYCFDVPVKILATMLVVMCTFLLLRDNKRLINFFFRNLEALPANLSPHRFKARWKNISLSTIKYVLIAYVVSGTFFEVLQISSKYGDGAKKPPLYGIYNVERFARNKDTLPPLTTDTSRWSKLIIGSSNGLQVKFMNDSLKYYSFKEDTIKHNITINTYADTIHKFLFTYTSQKPGILIIKGKWKQDSLYIRMRSIDPKNFLLLKRGFHWVNEHPLNK